jgi:hypothetical protein
MNAPTEPKGTWISTLPVGLGLLALAVALPWSVTRWKQFERTVTVKGLSEREVDADLAVWPLKFTVASNNLQTLYRELELQTEKVLQFLKAKGFSSEEVTPGIPLVSDRLAVRFAAEQQVSLRYVAERTVTVRSTQVSRVRDAMLDLPALGKEGLAIAGNEYQPAEFLFTRLNELKPAMIEEATKAAREVAVKFARDSESTLGKIRSASQGQFSIEDLDSSTPHRKKVRVVSTIEYYLSD